MAINSKRAIDIATYIKNNPDCEQKSFKHVIEISGIREPLTTYYLPLNLISFNHDNGRFFWEIQDFEHKLGRKLNPLDLDDESVIRNLLLHDPEKKKDELSDKAQDLYEDIQRVGQLEPGGITQDGILINGNRRMAVLQKLNKDEPSGKWNKMWVYILPKGISDEDLWGIEAGLQLSEKKIAEYGPLNELLKIKAGRKLGLTNEQIAAKMYGWTPEKVKEKLQKLDLMENFLQLIGQPNNYGVINKYQMNEIFEDVQSKILLLGKKKGVPEREIAKRLQRTYILIRSKIPSYSVKDFNLSYNNIRTLGDIYNDEKYINAKLKFDESFEGVKDITKVDSEKLVSNFRDALEKVISVKLRDKPIELLNKALTALEGVDTKNSVFLTSKEVKAKVLEIEKRINQMLKILASIK